ncbi:extracellular solute-binding protein family 5 [Hydrogenobaculum sp. Y04AAS1]|uniref:ABC transporter substrate-binding protein n=1 Tax=Hydrogenobaculum sp. (strain Y04AAS1) TaxID=380749 RepID=UPI00015BD5F7|nr:extracellular solute-binding protein family 5 [Hydrogenobaculum sp. Y04AAS1]HCT66869.1 ABC transporter substrate-binding protein [Hydrogenobaculum sp.]
MYFAFKILKNPYINGILFTLICFLPIYFSKSPKVSNISIKTVDLRKAHISIGKTSNIAYIVLASDPKTLNPVLAQETSSTDVIAPLFNGLTKIDLKTMSIKPELASSWKILNNGKTYIIYLRKGLKWSDGKPLTAYDVEFTYNDIYYNPHIPNSIKDTLSVDGKPFKVKALNKYTVEFDLPHRFAPFLQSISAPILPKHILENAVKQNTFNTFWSVSQKPSLIVGSGPYKLVKYVKGQYVEYEANPYYYKSPKNLPYIKRIKAFIIQDKNIALIQFLEGDISYIGLSPEDLSYFALNKPKTPAIVYDLGETPTTTFITFNQNPHADIPKYKLKWFQNRFFRVAISYAIDRKAIASMVYNNMASPLYGPITPANRPYYKKGLFKRYPFNLSKAKKLFIKAGFYYKKGKLYDKDGHRVEFSLITNSDAQDRKYIGAIVKEDLEKIGIKVIFQPIDFNSLVSKLTTPPYQWESVLIGLTGSIDPNDGKNVWYSKGSLHIWHPMEKKPATLWEKELDTLFDEGSKTINPKKRIDIYRAAFYLIQHYEPMVFIVTPKSLMTSKVYMKNFYPTVWGFYKKDYMYIKR